MRNYVGEEIERNRKRKRKRERERASLIRDRKNTPVHTL